ncbi:MAG: hydantoinase/oxoprolinase family protein [Candidatus Tectomicrobia bacterium]|nr:hydantoinase/oxoprolinase family protein [Candidatus Tectomicrobia bacterium]
MIAATLRGARRWHAPPMPQEVDERTMYKIAVDIGGTFTDCVVMDAQGRTWIAKGDTTPEDPARGVLEVVEVAARQLELSRGALLAQTEHFMHGCTIATNAMIERKGVKTGLLTTRGHEDTVPIGRAMVKRAGLSEREMIHAVAMRKPEPPIITRPCIMGVAERIDFAGEVIVPLDLDDVKRAVDALRAREVRAVAVCFLWSFINPAHEEAVGDYLARQHPDLFVSLSSQIAPVLGEYERSVTTLLNAYLGPRVADYLGRLETALRGEGYRRPLLVMQSNGGLTTTQLAQRRGVMLLDSGPVGGTLGSRYFGQLYEAANIICTDVGGTSFDVSLVAGGSLQLEKEPVVEQYTFLAPKVLIKTIGAGGGSIAWVDEDNLLHVGPASAGAMPGPACYGRGGEQPTVTDANIVLGYLNAENFLGGRMRLDRGRAEQALEGLAARLGMDVVAAAAGIFRITNAQMADLVRRSTIERGYDPRQFILFSYGGAGPTHAPFFGRDIGAHSVCVLANSTVFSAFGIITSDLVHTAERSFPTKSPYGAEVCRGIDGIYADLERQVLAQFEDEGIAAAGVTLERSVFMRYQMQVHELGVATPRQPFTPEVAEAIVARFHVQYEELYGKGGAYHEAGTEFITFRVDGTHEVFTPRIERQEAAVPADASAALRGSRRAYFDGEFHDTPIYSGEALRFGHEISGPAVIERMGDTIVLPVASLARVDAYGNLSITWP